MNLTKNFKELGRNDAMIAGGKGASLGEMTQAGIPVPPGFVILSTTFDEFIKEADLIQEIDSIIDGVNHKEIHTVDAASEKIATEIKAKFKDLDTEFVAVRSSATAEDGADNAWAGQLDSYLNTKEDNLLEKVQHCWASLFTPRAIFYRFEKGLHTTKISVAVVVQKMVNSEVSGIAFSVHPVTEDRNQLIIEAGFGLGEAIVSGQITPDSYVVEKEPRRIIDVNVSAQTRALYRVQSGGNEWLDISEPKASSQVLTETQILEFADLIMKIENHYGFPCDIEWAFEKGKFYIVQSRPITTLKNKNIISNDDYKYFGFWPTPVLAAWYWIDWGTKYKNLNWNIILNEGSIFVKGGHYAVKLSLYKKIKEFIGKEIKSEDSIFLKNFKDHADKAFRQYSIDFKNINWKPKTKNEFLHIMSIIHPIMFFWASGHLISEVLEEILNNFVLDNKNSSFDSNMLKPSSQTIIELYFDDIQKIRTSLINKIGDKLDKNKIENVLKDGDFPKMISELTHKYEWIKSFKFYNLSLSLENIIDDLLNLNKTNFKKIISPNQDLQRIVDACNNAGYVRNSSSEWFSHFSFYVSRFLQSISQELHINYDDLLLLTPQEIGDVFNGESIEILSKIKKRSNNNWVLYKNVIDNTICLVDNVQEVQEFFNKNIKKYTENIQSDEEDIIGQSANKGNVRGRVKIILNQKDFYKFEDNDILVTTMTTPDFVVLMKRASAIITDIGGLLSHAAIVSRELNKPCIIDTKIATKVLKDGDMVEVDADKGIVKIIK